ncbi:hypothetical protein VTO73DRAFT_13903 [Trametes versicolor]
MLKPLPARFQSPGTSAAGPGLCLTLMAFSWFLDTLPPDSSTARQCRRVMAAPSVVYEARKARTSLPQPSPGPSPDLATVRLRSRVHTPFTARDKYQLCNDAATPPRPSGFYIKGRLQALRVHGSAEIRPLQHPGGPNLAPLVSPRAPASPDRYFAPLKRHSEIQKAPPVRYNALDSTSASAVLALTASLLPPESPPFNSAIHRQIWPIPPLQHVRQDYTPCPCTILVPYDDFDARGDRLDSLGA